MFGLIGLFIVGLLLVGALGLFRLRQKRLAEVAQEVAGASWNFENGAAADSPPGRNLLVSPCHWDGLGPGLCIRPLDGDEPIKILVETELEITGGPSWSPDGRHIAFSAVEPGQEQSVIHVVNAFGEDLTELPLIDYDVFSGLESGWGMAGL